MSVSYITKEELRSIFDEKLAPLRSDMTALREKLRETNSFLEEANAKYEEVKTKLMQHETERKNLITEKKILKSTVQVLEKNVTSLEDKCNELEQYSRRDCLEIKGIPIIKQEDTNEIVLKVAELVGVDDLSNEDISISHRLPLSKNYRGKRTDPAIIAKFVRREDKEKLYSARKHLKTFTTQDLGFNSKNNIYISESLTERNKKLFGECVKVKKKLHFSFIWSSNGRIFLRKNQDSLPVAINNKDELEKFQKHLR